MKEHRLLLIAVCISSFCCSFMGSSLNIAMPFMAADYNCSPENITWMLSSFTATSAAFLLAASALADRFGYLKIFLIGAFTSAIFTFLVGLTGDLLSGFIVRLIQGVCISLMFCTAMALISQRVPPTQRAFAIAYTVASVYAGLTFSPIIAGLIVDSFGWQVMFYATGALLLLTFFLAKTEKYDPPLKNTLPLVRMFVTFGLGVAILLALSSFTTFDFSAYVLYASLILLVVYLIYEAKNANPLFPIRYIMANKVMRYALLGSMFHYLASFIFILLLSMHMQLVLGFSASHTGFLLFIQPMFMVIVSSLSGKLSHIVGPQYLTISGMTLCASATLILLFLEPNSSLWLIFTSQFLMGVGFGLFSAPNTMIVMSSVEPHQFAMASAVQSISRTVGQATSMALLTAIMHYFVVAEQHTTLYVRELSYSIHFSFATSTCAFGFGLLFCLLCLYNRVKQVKALAKNSAQQNTNEQETNANSASLATQQALQDEASSQANTAQANVENIAVEAKPEQDPLVSNVKLNVALHAQGHSAELNVNLSQPPILATNTEEHIAADSACSATDTASSATDK